MNIDINNLSKDDALKFQAKLLGYKRMPVSINTFLDDEYYLGSLFGGSKTYLYWREILNDIYPTPIHTRYPYLVFTGCIGSGKSYCTRIMGLYNLHRLDCLNDYEYFNIVRTKPFSWILGSTDKYKAWDDLAHPMLEAMEESAYFMDDFTATGEYDLVTTGTRTNNEVGKEAIFYHWNEINFWNSFEVAKDKIDQSMDRYRSRFLKVEGFFGGIVIDSSAAGDESIVDYIIKHYPQFRIYRSTIWDAKKDLGIYFRKGSFDVYTGDEKVEPFIITPEKQLSEMNDPDKVIKVPEELRANYTNNIILALQNTAGISTTTTDKFFTNKSKVIEAFSIPNNIPETIQADFYNDDQYWELVREQILTIPKEKVLFIHIDLGITNDLTGIAISYFEDWIYKEGKATSEYKICTPFCVGIGRKPGEETAVDKIHNLIESIHEFYEIGAVTTDQYQSTQLRQGIQRLGIQTYLYSVDRTTDPYVFWKNLIYRGNNSIVKSDLLLRELLGLVDTGSKVDHPSDNSKDVSDAACGSVNGVRNNLEEAQKLSIKTSPNLQIDVLKSFNVKSNIYYEINKDRYKF